MVSAIILALIGISAAKITQSSVGGLISSKLTTQAKMYAESKMSYLSLVDYSELASQGKTQISDSDFYDEVVISDESTTAEGLLYKLATVNIYNSTETIPRFTLKKYFYAASGSDLDFEDAVYLGATSGGTITGTVTRAGFICAGGSDKPNSLTVIVNDVTLGYVCGRGYGTGTISACVPIPKNGIWTIKGKCDWAYFVALKS